MATQSQLEKPLENQLMKELETYIPERMDPGTVFVLENYGKLGEQANPFIAAFSCPNPKCGLIGLITRRQLWSGEHMICGSDSCSAEYRLDGDQIVFRKPQ